MKPEMNPKYLHLCKPSVPVTKWLFGDNLSGQVKDLQEEQKTTAGVLKRQLQPQPRRRYQPYNTYGRQRYYDAGWINANNQGRNPSRASGGGGRGNGRPFLGQHLRVHQMRRRYQRRQQNEKKGG